MAKVGAPRRRPWSRKLTPAQAQVVADRYHAGGNVREIMAEFDIGRTSLYRVLNRQEAEGSGPKSAQYWRIKYEQTKELLVEALLANKEMQLPRAAAKARPDSPKRCAAR